MDSTIAPHKVPTAKVAPPGSAASRLAAYLEAHGITQAEFSERIGVRQGSLSRIVTGTNGVSLAVAAAIERETAGAIRAAEWAPSVQGDAA